MKFTTKGLSFVTSSLTLGLAIASITGPVGCVKPRQTTAIGSGVGGAIGAGLGAIVGNQSGNAGSGVAIGAAAGAATGALIGNAIQAQEERTASAEEALKRQDRLLQAQKSEIAELRSIRGDTPPSYESSYAATPRYRYRQTSIDMESPEVARQRAKLQQRGPRPSGAAPSDDFSYRPAPKLRQSVETRSAAAPKESKVLARYDVRSELHEKPAKAVSAPERSQPVVVAPIKGAENPPSQASITKKAPLPESPSQLDAKSGSKGISETDIPVTQPAAAKLVAPTSALTAECKEALGERDKAAEASDNSDKLFHLRRALRLCPQNGALHYELGRVYSAMDRKTDAEGEFKQALTIDPSLVAAKNALSEMLKDEVQF